MKRIISLIIVILITVLTVGCTVEANNTDILTTTAPLYDFTTRLCYGTDITVDCLITESVSCLHDYTLQTKQMRAIESAKLIILSGMGLEDSFPEILHASDNCFDSSIGVKPLCSGHTCDHHDHDHENESSHSHSDFDPHIWLSPDNAIIAIDNIHAKLCNLYPHHQATIDQNYEKLIADMNSLRNYAKEQLASLSGKKLITFHDGFAYMADAFGLEILRAIEEESGREASAAELIELCTLIKDNEISCIFVETNGSTSAAEIIAAETNVKIFQLNMAMSGGYFEAMYQNINTLKEALG